MYMVIKVHAHSVLNQDQNSQSGAQHLMYLVVVTVITLWTDVTEALVLKTSIADMQLSLMGQHTDNRP
jgi:hypothetical protein